MKKAALGKSPRRGTESASMQSPNPVTQVATIANTSRNLIAARAYDIWQLRGCLHGRDQQDWFQAEQEVLTALRK